MTDPAPRIVRADTPQGPCAQLHGRWGAAELGTGAQWQAVSGQLRSHPAAPTLGWDLMQLQWLDHVGAQLLWNHWQHAWPERLACTVVLKGSGSVIAAPGRTPRLNATGNARLATPGSGDVLAGLIGPRLAAGLSAFDAACTAVYRHGAVADAWPTGRALTAGALARRLSAT